MITYVKSCSLDLFLAVFVLHFSPNTLSIFHLLLGLH